MTGETPQRLTEGQIDEVRQRTSIVALVGRRVKLRRAGRGWNGLCPFHKEKSPSFTVSDEKQFYHCFGCGAHGDVFRWVQEVEGVDFRSAVEQLAGGQLPDARDALPDSSRRASARSGQVHDIVSSTTAGRWIWRTSGAARGEIVETWLQSRGCDPRACFDGARFAIDGLRFHPRCPVSAWRVDDDPAAARLTAPAMVAPVRDGDGLVRGVHVTFLAHDGRSKAKLPLAQGRERPTRKMFGAVARNAVWLTPDHLADAGNMVLVVGEGIETAWSFAQGFGRPCRVAATLSLENLQGGAVKLRDGSLPLWNIAADSERPPFVIPDAGEVVIAVDADMKPLRGQKVQLTRGSRPVVADINGLQRAEICAGLAVQAWRRAGATKVSAVRPPVGRDFNDQARAA